MFPSFILTFPLCATRVPIKFLLLPTFIAFKAPHNHSRKLSDLTYPKHHIIITKVVS